MRIRNRLSSPLLAGLTLSMVCGCASPPNGTYLGERIDDPPQLSPFNQPLNEGQQQVTPYRGFLPGLGFRRPFQSPFVPASPDGVQIPPPYRSRFHSGGPLGGVPDSLSVAPMQPSGGAVLGSPRQPDLGPAIGGNGRTAPISPAPGNGQHLPPGGQQPNGWGTPRTYEKPVPTYPDPAGPLPQGPQLGEEQTIPQRPRPGELNAPTPAQPGDPELPDANTFDPARQPLVLSVNDPQSAVLKETAKFEIVIRNPFDVEVAGVVIECRFGEGFSFTAAPDRALRQRLGSLAPDESRTIDLALTVEQTGTQCVDFALTAEGRDPAAEQRCVEVIDPQATVEGVSVELVGPETRSVGGRLECVLTVQNLSGREVSGIVTTLQHDSALEPREASAGAEQSPGRMTWDLGLLRVAERVQIQVEFDCPTASEQTCIAAEISGRDLVTQKRELCAAIHPRPVLDVGVADSRDPVPVGETTTYLVTLTNRSLRPMSDLRIDVEADGGLEIIPRGSGISEVSLLEDSAGGARTATFHVSGPISPEDSRNLRIDVRGAAVGVGSVRVTATEIGTDRQVTVEEPTVVNPPLLDLPSIEDVAGGK